MRNVKIGSVTFRVVMGLLGVQQTYAVINLEYSTSSWAEKPAWLKVPAFACIQREARKPATCSTTVGQLVDDHVS